MSLEVNFQIIKDSSLGNEMDDNECRQLAEIMKIKQLGDSEILVPEGGSDDTLFLLAEGSLVVTSNFNNEEKLVYTMKKGECAGTRAFVDSAPRRATLRSSGNSIVYSLEPDAFEGLIDSAPRVVYKVMRAIFRITHKNLMRMNQETEALSNYISKTGGRF